MTEKKSLQFLNGFALRIVAMTFMVIDHAGVLLSNYQTDVGGNVGTVIWVLRLLGRIAFPLFIFLLAEGMHYTRNGWKYMGRIGIIYGLILLAEIIYIFGLARNPSLANGDFPGRNPFTDLVLVGFVLFALNQKGAKKLFALIPAGIIILACTCSYIEAARAITISWFPYFLRPDYGMLGLCFGLGFYFARPIAKALAKKACQAYDVPLEDFMATPDYRRNINAIGIFFFLASTLIFWGISYVTYDLYNMGLQSYCLLAIPFLFLYSGKRGYDSKWFRIFSYAFFPVHLVILFLIFFVSFGHI